MEASRFRFRAWDGEDMWTPSNVDELRVQELCMGVACDCPTDGEQTKLIIMQSTGLCDKDGVEIFEGDILQGSDSSPHYSVIFEGGSWRARYRHRGNGGAIPIYGKQEMFEIIGNIHQHPELLEPQNAN